MSTPWPFVAWGMDVIRPIKPATSNGHRFILVAIDYFTKWVEAKTFKSVTKKAVVDFVRSNIIYRFGIPKVIITGNSANLNSHLMKELPSPYGAREGFTNKTLLFSMFFCLNQSVVPDMNYLSLLDLAFLED
ncbi:uncharacterized protein [Nicotiana sylvestris]|uniref:uncharacterized protein n=1 Tax=Nicotiana sylvestris TaxID=4096 RepID=UPI00388CDEDF